MKNIVCCKDYMENPHRNDRRFVRVNSLLKSEELRPIIERSFQKELLASNPGADLL
jgi:hypothetical protein